MSEYRKQLGKKGEDLAAALLVSKGFEILERNWRYSKAEVDILARRDDLILVVEVKTRSSGDLIDPAASVSLAQWNRLADAYAWYTDTISFDGECRFDIIGIHFDDNESPEIRHYEDVFWPG